MAPTKELIPLLQAMKAIPAPREILKTVERLGVGDGREPRDAAEAAVGKAVWLMTGTGVVASLPGAIPGLGTAVQTGVTSSTLTAETWLLLRNLTAMQLVVAGIYGHDLTETGSADEVHPDRLNELLLVWGLETGAVVPATEAGKRIGTKVAVSQFDKRVSGVTLQRINQRVGTTVVTKWGTKRGGVALGKLIPFGVGAAVGGGINYIAAKSFGNATLKFYEHHASKGPDDAGGEVVILGG